MSDLTYAFDVTEDTKRQVEARRLRVRLAAARLYYDLPYARRPTPKEIFKDNFERLKESVASQTP